MTERPQRERSQTEQRLTVRRSKGVVARQRASGVRGIALILGMLTGGSLCAGWLGPRWLGWQNPCFAPSPRPRDLRVSRLFKTASETPNRGRDSASHPRLFIARLPAAQSPIAGVGIAPAGILCSAVCGVLKPSRRPKNDRTLSRIS